MSEEAETVAIELRRGVEAGSRSCVLTLLDGRRALVHFAEGETPPRAIGLDGIVMVTAGGDVIQIDGDGGTVASTLPGQVFDVIDRGGTFVVVHEIGAAEFAKGRAEALWTIDADIVGDWRVEGTELVLEQLEDGAVVRKDIGSITQGLHRG